MSAAGSWSLLAVAGEASADNYLAQVLRELAAGPAPPRVLGMGLAESRRAGLEPLVDASGLAVVGLSEALGALRRALDNLRRLEQWARRHRPRAALLLDLPDFNLPLAGRLARLGIPVVYYLAPQAWAWRRGRVRRLERRVAKLAVVFPFEEKFFSAHGVPTEFVGHPLCRRYRMPAADRPDDRVVLLPGSRRRERQRLLGPMLQAARLLQRRHPHLRFEVVPAGDFDAAELRRRVERLLPGARLREDGAAACLPGARLAVCASGTVTLEAALAGVPQVVIYKLSALSYQLVSRLVTVPWACMVNLLAGRELVPELLQGRVEPLAIAARAEMLLWDSPERRRVLRGYRRLAARLAGRRPAERVAELVREVAL